MSKIECTAVNELIDLVQSKPMMRDSEQELLFSAPPSGRQPKGTQPPPLFSTAAPVAPMFPIDAPAYPAAQKARPYRVAIADPASTPLHPPAYAAQTPVDAEHDHARTKPVKRTVFPVELSVEPTEARATMPVIWTKKPQFEPTPRDELDTHYIKRQAPMRSLVRQLAIPMGILLVSGIAIGGMITFRGEGKHQSASHVSAPSRFATPALAALPPPKVEPIEAAPQPAAAPTIAEPERPKLVDVRLESTPPGATATLLSNGVTTPLGTTPVDASVDPAKSYDVVFALDGRPPKVEHLDPKTTQHLQVALEDAAPPKADPVATAKPSHRHHSKKQAARVASAPAPRAAPAARAPAASAKSKQVAALQSLAPASSSSSPSSSSSLGPAPTAKAGPPGTLSISTTPTCAILIDGQNSGLSSPQAAISLPAGHHTVRLIAAPQHINKLVAVDITPKHTTKLVQDFSK